MELIRILMSPSIGSWQTKLETDIKTCKDFHNIKYIYMDVGTKEEGRFTHEAQFLDGCKWMQCEYLRKGLQPEKMKFSIFEGATHCQKDWRPRFPDAVRWIYQDI